MVSVAIQNLTALRVDKRIVREIVEETLRYTETKGIISIGVALVEEKTIQNLNKKHNGKNKATDVLSFGYDDNFVVPSGTGKYLGEIVVCPAVVKKHAAKDGVSFKREFIHVIAHGTLHLLGWEHEKNDADAKRMHAKEEEIMQIFG